MARLTGKVALIVGGGADGPAKAGDKLSLELAQQTAAAIREEGGRADAIAADVSIEDQCRGAVEATTRAFSAIHLLVNNVGIAIGGNLLKTSTENFDKMLAVNLRSHFLMMRYAVPEIAKAG